jgi:hypothetical protein
MKASERFGRTAGSTSSVIRIGATSVLTLLLLSDEYHPHRYPFGAVARSWQTTFPYNQISLALQTSKYRDKVIHNKNAHFHQYATVRLDLAVLARS